MIQRDNALKAHETQQRQKFDKMQKDDLYFNNRQMQDEKKNNWLMEVIFILAFKKPFDSTRDHKM